jgi:hypothetical protein
MNCEIAFSAESFGRLIKYRVADSFRPLVAPVNYPQNKQSWLDGVLVTQVALDRLGNDRGVVVNELNTGGSLTPNPAGFGYQAAAVSMQLTTSLFFALAQDVADAGLGQPLVMEKSIPGAVLFVTVRLDIGSDGVPVLGMQIDPARLAQLDLPPEVVAPLARAANATFPFDIGGDLKDILPPGQNRVLNAGITRDTDGSVVLRFEFPDAAPRSAIDRANEWQLFHSADYRSNLGPDDNWSVDLDGDALAAVFAAVINPQLKDQKPITFDAGFSSGYIGDATPRVVVTKQGRIENACAGNDVRFPAFANADLTVLPNGILRGALSFDLKKNGWDVAKCVGLTLVNPLTPIITAFDYHHVGVGIAIGLASPPVLAQLELVLLLKGVDQTIARNAVNSQLKKNPMITQLPDGGFAYDKALDFKNGLTEDWLSVDHCTGHGGRLLLGGVLGVPDVVLPRLTATDIEGMSKWSLVDRCEPGRGQVARGSLVLTLTPGYGAEVAEPKPVRQPTIPLKWGVRPTDGGNYVFQVLNDSLGIYQDQAAEYTEIYVPGIPGVVEVALKESTVRKTAYSAFGPSPYPLRLRFFTNGGVREYQFAAPQPLVDYNETLPQAAERINRCKHLGSDLLLARYLAVKWLGHPPERGGLTAQQWEVHVRGLEPGRAATVWNQDTGVRLVRAFADRTGRVDVSLVLQDGDRADSLLMGLDDVPFLRAGQVRRPSAAHSPDGPVPSVEVVMRQTRLTAVDHLDFDEAIEALHLAGWGTHATLVVRLVSGRELACSIPSPYVPGLATPTSVSEIDLAKTDVAFHGQAAWRGKERQFTLLSMRPGRTDVVAEYSARSSHDLAAGTDDLHVQASTCGHRITLFQKGVPVQFGTHGWEDTAGETDCARE